MGCNCFKPTPEEEQAEVHQDKTSKFSRWLLKFTRKEEVHAAEANTPNEDDTGALRLIPKSQEDVGIPSLDSQYAGKNGVPVHAIEDGVPPKNLIAHRRRATVDGGGGDVEPPPISGINHVPNGLEAEQVAAGWPSWLVSVAGEAIRGWVPRRPNTFTKLDKIGEGTYSTVFKARDLESKQIVALKKVRFVNMDPESIRFMAREIHVLRRLDHPNVIKLKGLITSRNSHSLYLVFEYMEHDLAGLSATPGIKFTEPQVKCYMQQLLRGLDHCHDHGVLHRDIKGANLLIDNDGVLKIADFGLATTFSPDQQQPLTSHVVTLWYRPPELLLGATEYDVSVDLWSTGCILAEMLAGKPIMPGRTEVEQMHKIFKLCGSPSNEYWRDSKLPHATIFKPHRPYRRRIRETFKEFPSSAVNLLDVLLKIKPEDRGTAASALNSGFFTTKPYACDPSTLPNYPPSKELDAKNWEQEARRQRAAAAKENGSHHARKGLKETKGVADVGPSLQKTQTRIDPSGEDLKENGGGQFTTQNGTAKFDFSYSGSLQHITAFGSSWATRGKVTGSVAALGKYPSTVRGSKLPDPEFCGRLNSQESSSVSGQGFRRNKVHYSGPLMPPGAEMEEMLKEHERHIQQAVRKARLEKKPR